MSSGDEAAIKALIAVIGRPGWQDDGPRMMVGVSLRQSRGHWDTTTANAWGTVAARKFAGLYPAGAIAGTTTAALGPLRIARGDGSWCLVELVARNLLGVPGIDAIVINARDIGDDHTGTPFSAQA